MATKVLHSEEPIQVVHYQISRVRMVYDGKEFKFEVPSGMYADGFIHWTETHKQEIAYARAICYANHIREYGEKGQIQPPKSEEYFTKQEADIFVMQQREKLLSLPPLEINIEL
jgi:hypothetical protein